MSTNTRDLLQQQDVLPDSKVHGAHMGPIWGRQDPGGRHVGPMNFIIWALTYMGNLTMEMLQFQHWAMPVLQLIWLKILESIMTIS